MSAFFPTPIESAPFTDRLRDLVARTNVMATHEPAVPALTPARAVSMPIPATAQQAAMPQAARAGAFSNRMNDLLAKYGR